jgi:predicted PurR-regulated permease PerM
LPADTPEGADAWDQQRIMTACLIIVATILFVAAITYLGRIVWEVLVALFLYYALKPGAEAIIRRHFPPWLAYMTLLAGVLVVFVLLGQLLFANAQDISKSVPEYEKKITALLDRLGEKNTRAITDLFEQSTQFIIRSAVPATMSVAEGAVVVFFYIVFMILNGQKLGRRIRRAFPADRAHKVLLIGEKINLGMQQYMKVKTLTSLGLAATMAPIMWLFGLQYWLLWAFLFFALNYITYLGALVALIPPILLALLQFDEPWTALIMGALLIVNRLLWIDYFEVRFSGKQLNLDPLLVLLSLVYWGYFWGVIGMILAVPMLTSLKIILANIESTKHWATLLSDE